MKRLRRIHHGVHTVDEDGFHHSVSDDELRRRLDIPCVDSVLCSWRVGWLQTIASDPKGHVLLLASLHGAL